MMDQNLGLHLKKKQCLSDKCHPMISSWSQEEADVSVIWLILTT